MADTNSPYHSARRLARAIERLQAESSTAPESTTFIELVALCAGMDMRNPAVLSQAQAIIELPREVGRDLGGLESEDARRTERMMRSISNSMEVRNLFEPWSTVYSGIGEGGISVVGVASILLDGQGNERRLDENELSRISEEIRNLLEEVRLTDGIAQDLQDFIEASLTDLLHAIDDYWLRGADAITDAIDGTVGRAVREQRFDNKTSLMKRLAVVLTRIAVVVAVANDVNSLPATVENVVQGVIEVAHSVGPADDGGPVIAGSAVPDMPMQGGGRAPSGGL